MVWHCCYSTKECLKSLHLRIFISGSPTGDLNIIDCNVNIISAHSVCTVNCCLIIKYLIQSSDVLAK